MGMGQLWGQLAQDPGSASTVSVSSAQLPPQPEKMDRQPQCFPAPTFPSTLAPPASSCTLQISQGSSEPTQMFLPAQGCWGIWGSLSPGVTPISQGRCSSQRGLRHFLS